MKRIRPSALVAIIGTIGAAACVGSAIYNTKTSPPAEHFITSEEARQEITTKTNMAKYSMIALPAFLVAGYIGAIVGLKESFESSQRKRILYKQPSPS